MNEEAEEFMNFSEFWFETESDETDEIETKKQIYFCGKNSLFFMVISDSFVV